jgi:hypothetical protein
MTVYLPLAFAVIGLLVYAIANQPKPVEIGRIMFWCGLLAFLFKSGEAFGIFTK